MCKARGINLSLRSCCKKFVDKFGGALFAISWTLIQKTKKIVMRCDFLNFFAAARNVRFFVVEKAFYHIDEVGFYCNPSLNIVFFWSWSYQQKTKMRMHCHCHCHCHLILSWLWKILSNLSSRDSIKTLIIGKQITTVLLVLSSSNFFKSFKKIISLLRCAECVQSALDLKVWTKIKDKKRFQIWNSLKKVPGILRKKVSRYRQTVHIWKSTALPVPVRKKSTAILLYSVLPTSV